MWDSSASASQSYVAKMRKVFNHPVRGRDVAQRLLALRQGSHSVAESEWNDEALWGVFVSGLSEAIKDERAAREETDPLEELITLAIKLDNRLCERCKDRASHPQL